MSTSRFKRLRTIAFVLAIVTAVAALCLRPSRLQAENPATAPATSIATLQQQRVDTLREASDLAHRMYSTGVTPFGDVCRIDRLLLDAKLEVAPGRDEQLKLLHAAVDVAKRQEELLSRQAKSGFAPTVAVLEAKADRLRIEIQLAKISAN